MSEKTNDRGPLPAYEALRVIQNFENYVCENCAKIAESTADGTGNEQWDLACAEIAKRIRATIKEHPPTTSSEARHAQG